MSGAILEATIRAYDEFAQQFQKFRNEIEKTDQEQKRFSQGTDRTNDSVAKLFRTLGQLGILYAYQRALLDIIRTGSELESTIARVAVITGEATEKFRKMAMESKSGLFAPRELATGFVDIAAAGFNADQIEKMYGAIEKLAVGGMVDFQRAAEPAINVLKTWNLEAEKSTHIADAFVEASNASSLQVEDLSLALAMSSAAAKLAGMDFEELLTVLGVLRDAGMQASDAGTSIKSALLGLMNPSKEAADIMKLLNIHFYDGQGKMKTWAGIVDELSSKTSAMDDQTRNFVLTTIAGSDGIRALALSMNRGGDAIRAMTEDLKNADGVAQANADEMRDTFAGAWKEATSELEKFKSVIFEDIEPALTKLAGAVSTVIRWLKDLPAPIRVATEVILGAGGLLLALGSLSAAFNTLKGISILASMTTAAGAMDTVAVSAGAAAGSVGMLYKALFGLAGIGAIAIPIAAGYGAYKAYNPANNQAWDDLFRTGSFNPEKAPGQPLSPERWSYNAQSKKSTASESVPFVDVFGHYMGGASGKAHEAGGAPPSTLEEFLKSLEALKGGEEDPFQAAMDQFNHLVAVEQLTYAQQLASLESIKAKYADTDKERWEIEERVFDLKKRHAEEEKKNLKEATEAKKDANQKDFDEAYAYYQYLVGMDQMTYEERISYLQRMLASRVHTAEQQRNVELELHNTQKQQAHERERALKEVQKAQEDAWNKDYGDAMDYYQYLVSMGRLTTEQRINYMQRVLDKRSHTSEQERQAEIEIHDLQLRLIDEREKRQSDEFNTAIDFLERRSRIAGMTIAQQIDYLERLQSVHKWTYGQMQDIEERLYQLRSNELSNYWGKVGDAYQEALDEIEGRTNKTISGLQSRIDALDNQGTMASREDTQRKHNQKLTDLQDQLQYYQLRAGKDAAKKVQEFNQQIADENYNWQKQQDDWEREDQRKLLQAQIQDARDAGKEERDELESHYKQVRQIAEDGILDTIAGLAATKPEWIATGKSLIDSLIEGLKSGDFSVVENTLKRAREATSASSQIDRLNAQIFDLRMQWGAASDQTTRDSLHTQADVLRSQIKALGGIPAYAGGGPVDKTGLIYAHQGEYIHSAKETSQLAGLLPVLMELVRATQGRAVSGDTIQIYFTEPISVRSDQDIEAITNGVTNGIFGKLQAARRGTGGRM